MRLPWFLIRLMLDLTSVNLNPLFLNEQQGSTQNMAELSRVSLLLKTYSPVTRAMYEITRFFLG